MRKLLFICVAALLCLLKSLLSSAGYHETGRRTQYHQQGMHGPSSYKFGFHTGDRRNPQSRHEERDGYGNVRGHYSYMDASGRIQVVHYEADRSGYRVLDGHHHQGKS